MYQPFKETKTETPLEPWRQALMDAANVIREGGWCQFTVERGTAHCMLGAILKARTGKAWERDDVTAEAHTKLDAYLGTDSIVDWNNAPGRTADEVIATLEAAALSGAAQ